MNSQSYNCTSSLRARDRRRAASSFGLLSHPTIVDERGDAHERSIARPRCLGASLGTRVQARPDRDRRVAAIVAGLARAVARGDQLPLAVAIAGRPLLSAGDRVIPKWTAFADQSKTVPIVISGESKSGPVRPTGLGSTHEPKGLHAHSSHSDDVMSRNGSFAKLATDWHLKGEISEEVRDEIMWLAESTDKSLWRPLLYVIPRNLIAPDRLQRVRGSDRAGVGAEYIIGDLQNHEFDLIEM